MRSKPTLILSISQALFTLPILLFFFTALDGYILNLLSGYRANLWLETIAVLSEFAGLYWLARQRVFLERNALELAGFLVTVAGVWIYFILPSLPTLLPPTQSEDAVHLYQQVMFAYPEGKLVGWYPAGGTFVVAMFSHWLGWDPLRVLHPTAAFLMGLCAGAVYSMTYDLLKSVSSSAKQGAIDWGKPILALIAPALLFVPWSYYAGMIDWEQYFFAQAFAQLFILAALWYTMSYVRQPNRFFIALIGVALVGIVMVYPILVGLPFGLFALVVIVRALRGAGSRALVPLGIFIALLIILAFGLDRTGILGFGAARISVTSDVGEGGVTTPSLESFGGAIFLLLALVGIPFAWRANANGKLVLGLVVVWALQYLALIVVQPFFNISGYRVDKTFYILVFPLAMLAALVVSRGIQRISLSVPSSPRVLIASWLGAVAALGLGVAIFRPPIAFSPLTESELQAAQWAKKNLDTYQISYLDPMTIRAYWLAFGLWSETVPYEWYQWIPEGTKLGPPSFSDWLADPSWPRWILLRDVNSLGSTPVQIVYRTGNTVIAQKNLIAIEPPAPARLARWHFGSIFNLIGYDLPREKIAPGETLTFTTETESIYPPVASVRWRAMLVDRNERVISQMERDPFDNKYPVQRWPPGRRARDDWALPIRADAAPGIYELRLGLFFRDSGEWQNAWPILADGLGKPLPNAPLAKIKIPMNPPSAEELRAAQSLDAHVGDNFLLTRYALDANRDARRVRLTLYWQDITKTQTDYTVFVHLLDASDKIIAQIDREPASGAFPTSSWDAEEVIKDEYSLEIPADASGPLKIEVGMYSQPSLKRLPIGETDHIVIDVP